MSYPARIFGVTSTLSGLGTGIIVNSMSYNDSVQVAEARNEKGKLLDLAAYSFSNTTSIDGLYTGGEGTAAGDVVTINGKDYLIESNTHNENNTEFQTSSLSLRGGEKDGSTVMHSLSSIYAESPDDNG